MTVSTTGSTAQFFPNGVTTHFPFAFRFFQNSDLKVFWQDTLGVIHLLVLNSDYTVTGAGSEDGGAIDTIGTPIPNGQLIVSRVMVATQLTSFRNQGEFFAEIHEDAFDRLVMLVQQTLDSQSRVLTVPPGDSLSLSLVLPGAAARADKVMAFDALGQPIQSNLTLAVLEQQPAQAASSAAAALASANAADASADAALISQNAAAAIATSLQGSAVPLFTVHWWPGVRAAIPAGYVPGDGQTLSRALYPDAWTGINAGNMPTATDAVWNSTPAQRGKYTVGDGATTFRVPDYNGKFAGSIGAPFLRGDGALSAAVAGVIRTDQFQGHRMSSPAGGNFLTTIAGAAYGSAATGGSAFNSTGDPISDGTNGAPRFGLETRPIDICGCFVIKLFGAVTNQGAADAALLATEVATLASRCTSLENRATALEFGYISAQQTFTNGGTLSLTHGLGSRPLRVTVEAVCLTTEHGYAVGDVVMFGEGQQLINSGGTNFGLNNRTTATQILVKIAAGGLVVLIISTGVLGVLTPANWRLVFKGSKS